MEDLDTEVSGVKEMAQAWAFGNVAAVEKFTLAGTGLEVSFPKARIWRPSGDAAARGVIPDIVIVTPLAATQDDRVLQQALAAMATHPRRAERVSTGAAGR